MKRKDISQFLNNIWKRHPESKKYRVFYYDLPDEVEQIEQSVRNFHSLQMVPWPDQRCIVIVPSVTPNALLAFLIKDEIFISFMFREGKFDSQIGVFKISLFDCPEYVTLKRVKQCKYLSPDWADQRDGLIIVPEGKAILFENKKFEEYVSRAYKFTVFDRIAMTSSMLVNLTPLITPCGYRVKVKVPQHDKKGRSIESKTIETIINFNRFYNLYEESTGEKVERKPHPRRGHLRFWWKYSGVDKTQLPTDPVERIRFAFENEVKKSHIKPTWCGDKEFKTKDDLEVSV